MDTFTITIILHCVNTRLRFYILSVLISTVVLKSVCIHLFATPVFAWSQWVQYNIWVSVCTHWMGPSYRSLSHCGVLLGLLSDTVIWFKTSNGVDMSVAYMRIKEVRELLGRSPPWRTPNLEVNCRYELLKPTIHIGLSPEQDIDSSKVERGDIDSREERVRSLRFWIWLPELVQKFGSLSIIMIIN